MIAAWWSSAVGTLKSHEEGGWVYENFNTGEISVRYAPRGDAHSIDLNHPAEVTDAHVVATFHTHPNAFKGYSILESGTDRRLSEQRNIPGIVYNGVGPVPYGPARRGSLEPTTGPVKEPIDSPPIANTRKKCK